MASCTSTRRRAGIVASTLAIVVAGCLPAGSVDASYGGPAGIALPCLNIASTGLAVDVGGAALIACGYAVPDTTPTQYAIRLLSLRADGSPDAAFGGDGTIELPGTGTDVAVMGLARSADGAVWVSRLVGSSAYRIYRYRADGTLDEGFAAPAGSLLIGNSLRAAKLLPAGSDSVVLVTQETATCSGCGSAEGLRVRTFGPTGLTAPPVTVALNQLVDAVPPNATDVRVVLDPQALGFDGDYRLLIGGALFTRYTSANSTQTTGRDLGVVRVGDTGVDTTYGDDGVVRLDLGLEPDGTPALGLDQPLTPTAMAIAHGEVSFGVGPAWNPGGLVGRLAPDGSPDPTFDGDGLRAMPASFETYTGLTVDDQRRVVVAAGDGQSAALLRFTASGAVDSGFGSAGRAELPQAGAQVFGAQVVVPLARIHVLLPHTQQGDNGMNLIRIGH